jgi:hypothetical protein
MKISRADVGVLINELDKLVFKKIQEELENRLNGGKGKIVYTNKPFVVDPRFVSLPKEVQEAISYSGWKEKMYDIAKKFKLNIEQTGLLEEITTKVILNTIHADQYENEIRSKIDLGDDKIKEMVIELNENIFKNIKEVMKNASGNEEKKIPAPPYAKTIKNEELGIRNVEEKITEIKKEDIVPLPPPVFSSTPAKGAGGSEIPVEQKGPSSPDIYREIKPAQKEIEDIISNKGVGKKESDMYREHGIEIIETIKNEELGIKNEKQPVFASPPAKGEMSEGQRGSNIITDKLFGNTTSKTTVSDYSLPKINKDQENTHDPYHESI